MTKGECNDALQELYQFLDGELTPERRATIKDHLDDCNPCLAAFDFEGEIRLVISQKCREQVPEHLRARIAEAITNAASAAPTDSPDLPA